METNSENFAKQYSNKQENDCEETLYIKFEHLNQDVKGLYERQDMVTYENFDEPIDLTSSNKNLQGSSQNENFPKVTSTNASSFLKRPPETVKYLHSEIPYRRHRRRRQTFTVGLPNDSVFQPYPSPFENHYQNSPSKQEEVLKAAKSLFSKRTRTLYHWMYPNAPKQQIKSAVATSWESLGSQEKEFYISQVLGRFGFPPCSLMINPQLGGIKELPPLPDTQDFISSSSNELQNAISSISGNSQLSSGQNGMGLDESDKFMKRSKKKKGRPFGSKNKKSVRNEVVRCTISHEFHDDPELRKELEQFAINMYETRIK